MATATDSRADRGDHRHNAVVGNASQNANEREELMPAAYPSLDALLEKAATLPHLPPIPAKPRRDALNAKRQEAQRSAEKAARHTRRIKERQEFTRDELIAECDRLQQALTRSRDRAEGAEGKRLDAQNRLARATLENARLRAVKAVEVADALVIALAAAAGLDESEGIECSER